jgi:hypothetical protein
MTDGVDYSSGHPGGAALKAAGKAFAARYVSHSAPKNISKAEAADLAAHGVWTVLVWETTAQRAGAGRAAGVADAKEAVAQAAAAGMPPTRPLYFAVDWDAEPAVVAPYFQGVASVLGAARTGGYGGYRVVRYLLDRGLITWAWQTAAWSSGRWDARAHIRQPATTVRINGVACDNDIAQQNDFGQWMPGGITPEEDDVALSDADKKWLTDTIDARLTALVYKLVWQQELMAAPSTAGDVETNPTRWPENVLRGAYDSANNQGNKLSAAIGAIGTGGLADELALQLGQLEITVTKKGPAS